MQKIIIKYLGPVRELEMEIKDFNLLIGEQATGKSTVAKAIYFFRIIKSTLTDYLCQLYDTALYNGNDVSDGFNKVLKKELKSVFISLFGYSWDLDKRLYLRYEYATGIWIDVKLNDKGKKQYISVRYSPKLAQTLKTLEEEALDLFEQKMETATISLAYASRERLRNYDNFKNRVNEIFDDYKETYYIPAGRSMLTLLVNNRSLLENDNLDLITRQFMQVIDNIHRVFEDGIKNVHKRYPDGERKFDVTKTAEMLISDLKGDYRYNAGKEYIVIEEDAHSEKIPINFASSGQQEVLWLLNQLYILMLKKEKAFVIIEEPEAHLYPGLQSKVVEFISYFANVNDSAIFITTHAVDAALNLYDLLHGKGDLEAWKKMQKKSLCSGFNDADSSAIIAWNKRMQELVRMDEIAKDIRYGKPVKETAALEPLTQLQENWLERRLKRADFSETVRLNYYIGTALGSRHGDRYVAESFKTISGQILEATLQNLQYNDSCKIVTEKHTVNLPLRVNWGGGWSDTPPICCEMGGTVLNAAISLNRELPVEVTLIKIPEKKIVFDSRDMDVHGEFDSIEELQKTGDPYDPFALQKACLLACGIIPSEGGSLDEILTRLGGGFEMHSEVTNVPKGSGLGTSSILSAACVKAVFEFMGISYTEEELYAHVLVMEQIMSTGGGWQDQVGGVTNGIKYITSKPGLDQQLRVEHIELQPETKKELNERFCLIYTGQRRLARNLLRDVVGRYVGNEPDSLYALNEIQKVAALMRFELERGKIDEFADLLNYHWELSRKVDAGSTNTLIDQIFLSIEDLIDAKMVCGAGGGGFLQVILKKGVQKADVHKRLKDVFQDNPVDVWDCEII